MDRSLFESKKLSIRFFSVASGEPAEKLQGHFREHFNIDVTRIDGAESLKDCSFTTEAGGIVALQDAQDDDEEGVYRDWETQQDVPIELAVSLENPNEQRRFVNRVYGYYRWEQFRADASSFSDLLDFHSHEKLTLLAHDPVTKEELGHMLANPPDIPFDALQEQYFSQYQKAIRQLPTRGRHFNVFEHLYGYLIEFLPDPEREDLLELIRDFRKGKVPLIEPLTELKKQFRKESIDWVSNQSYLNPKREELAIKSEIEAGP